MAQFRIEIAGQVAEVTSVFESTRDYCRAYLTEKAPDVSFAVTREDMDFEQALLRAEALEEGFRLRTFTDPFLDRAAIQRKMAEHLFTCDTILLHGSAVAVDGEGFLFTARSGTGKSTHTRLWRQMFAQRAVMINDDKPFVQIRRSEILISGAPWSGKHGLDTNITVPLKGICILDRGAENRIHAITPEEARPMLHKQSCPPLDPEKQPRFLALLEELMQRIPLWHMECTKDPQAAAVAYGAMSPGQREIKNDL